MKGSVDLEQPYIQDPVTTNPSYAQSAPVNIVAEVIPAKGPLPCCGLGIGWTLFILGFLLATIPWYVGAILLCCALPNKDSREKPGCIACLIAAIFISLSLVVTISILISILRPV